MDRKDWLLLGCTLALIVTLVACTWWLRNAMGYDLSYVMRDLEQMQR